MTQALTKPIDFQQLTKDLRKHLGLNQTQFGMRFDVSLRKVRQWESENKFTWLDRLALVSAHCAIRGTQELLDEWVSQYRMHLEGSAEWLS